MGKCLEEANRAISEFKSATGDKYIVDQWLFEKFSQVCNSVDILCDEFDLGELSVSVDYATLDINVSVLCDGIEVDTRMHNKAGKDNMMLVIMKVANKVTYTNVDKGDTLKIEFSFPRIWEKNVR